MGLQTTGQITLNEIGTELGDTSAQKGMGEYKGLGNVPDTNIAFSGFYGFELTPDAYSLGASGATTNGKYMRGTTISFSPSAYAASPAVRSAVSTYRWTDSLGGTYVSGTGTSKSFTVPNLGSDTSLTVYAYARDAQGDEESTPVSVTITMGGYIAPTKPTISTATAPSLGFDPGSSVSYNVTNYSSTSPIGRTQTYSWQVVSNPSNDGTSLSGTSSGSFSAPSYDPSADSWDFQLRVSVSDGYTTVYSDTATVKIKRKQRVLDFVRLAYRTIGKRSSTTQSTPQPFLPTSIQEGDVMIVMATYSTDDTGDYDHPLHGQGTNSNGEVTGIPTMISTHGFENLMASYDYGRDLPWDSAGVTENSLDYMTPMIAGPYFGRSYLAGFWKKITATDVANKGSTLNLFNTGQTWGNEEWHIYVFRTGNTNTPVGGVDFIGSDELFYSRVPRYGTSNTAKGTIRIYTNSTKTALRYGQGDANDKMVTGSYVGKNGVLLVCCASTSQNALYPSKHTSDSQMTNHYYGWWESSIDQSSGLRDYTTSTSSTWQDNRIYTQAIQGATYARYSGDWYTQYGMRLSTMITQYMGDTTNKYCGLMYSGTDASYNRWYTTTGGYYKDIAIELSQSSSASSGSYFGSTSLTNQDWTAYYGLINIWYDDPLY